MLFQSSLNLLPCLSLIPFSSPLGLPNVGSLSSPLLLFPGIWAGRNLIRPLGISGVRAPHPRADLAGSWKLRSPGRRDLVVHAWCRARVGRRLQTRPLLLLSTACRSPLYNICNTGGLMRSNSPPMCHISVRYFRHGQLAYVSNFGCGLDVGVKCLYFCKYVIVDSLGLQHRVLSVILVLTKGDCPVMFVLLTWRLLGCNPPRKGPVLTAAAYG